MKLSHLIAEIEGAHISGRTDVDVRDLVFHAGKVQAGDCFVAMRGAKADGHEYIGQAVERGAVAIVAARPVELPPRVTGIVVPDTRRALAMLSVAFFGDPSSSMALVGVTGTNGKTTITYLLEAMCARAGMETGVIGTVAYRYGGQVQPALHTTPESYDLQRLLARMRDGGVRACALEVSSHALVQERVTGCHFDAAIFTNLTPEHLDYHADMEGYFEAKALLFERLLATAGKAGACAVINADDAYGQALIRRCPVPVVRYGLQAHAEVRGEGLVCDADGLRMDIQTPNGNVPCRSHLCGRFNALNILGSVAAAIHLGIPPEALAAAIEGLQGVPGRFESIANDRGVLALVDYAHTPDALDNVLAHARELARGKVIAVFGCGGDRDRAKRPLMGRVVGRLADVAVVTSDNPRTEDPEAIIAEILPGLRDVAVPYRHGRGYEVMPDRRAAIARAVAVACAGDVIVVAGKGHEDYQIVGTIRQHFDDREELRKALTVDRTADAGCETRDARRETRDDCPVVRSQKCHE